MINSKLYSLREFREKMYENLEVTTSDSVILMCAMLIASIGLNMNSTSVIIGAMLISPLMTPILGIGVSLAIFDSHLLKKACKLLVVQVTLSLLASTVYFMISPITYPSSEIIARTSPTIWDVLIAFVGGTAGVIGARKKETNNIVPGVAIATALMPPVCTVGYAIASRNTAFFFGAAYLFIINCSFIIIATVIGVRLMMMRNHSLQNTKEEAKMQKMLIALSLVVVIPSIFSASSLVRESMKKEALSRFLSEQFADHVIISKNYNTDTKVLTLTISGKHLSKEALEEIYAKRTEYGVEDILFDVDQMPSLDNLDAERLTEFIRKLVEEKMDQEQDKEEKLFDRKIESSGGE